MGLMRRVESSIENAVGEPGPARADRPGGADDPSRRRAGGRALSVQPKELGRKLVKELEDHKVVSRQGTVLVDNRFTVYLCPPDYDRFAPRLPELIDKLEQVLSKHVRAKKYEPAGDLEVMMVREPDLRSGYFGIQAERASDGKSAVRSTAPPARGAAPPPPRTSHPAAQDRPAAAVHDMPVPGGSPAIVVKAGNRVREFNRSRVILGRARDADFQLEDPNVSRRHAALYWNEGRVMVEDLDSTNGTLVNGYPISSTVLRPQDVLVIGDTRVEVEIRSR